MSHPLKRIAVISMARNDAFFVRKWIHYYGSLFGQENLFLILDGHDQPLPDSQGNVNVIRLPHIAQSRSQGDRNRARLVSHMARALFHRYDIVIAHDIDELLAIDPRMNQTLKEYLQRNTSCSSLSGLGLDVGQHVEIEQPIDPTRPFLHQRSFAHVSARYTKPIVALRQLTWGSGFHRVKGRNFRIDPNLYLFHFGMVDFNMSGVKTKEQSLIKAGWKGHFGRRVKLFDLIRSSAPVDGDSLFGEARWRQSLFRPIYAINKPGRLREMPIVRIPERFRDTF